MSLPPTVTRDFVTAYDLVSVQRVPPGMSGAEIFRCQSSSGQEYALKRWPRDTKAARVAEVHRVQTAAIGNGCEVVPRLKTSKALDASTYFQDGGAIWELADWMPGSPLAATASLASIATGAAAIGRFHQSVRTLASQSTTQPPAVVRRLDRVRELEHLLPRAITATTGSQYAPALCETMRETAELLFGCWGTVAKRITQTLSAHLGRSMAIQYVLRDVHREHILFSGDEVTGLIDFDAIQIDTPATDLARWGGSFAVDRDDAEAMWESVMAGFCQPSPFLCEQDQRHFTMVIRDLHFSSMWISLANWTVWIRLESRTFAAGDHAIQARISQLCRSARQEL